MARNLTTTQSTNLEADATRPIFLVKWAWNGTTEYLSCSGAVTFDGNSYTAGGVNISSIEDSNQATLNLPSNTTRMTELLAGDWRGASCVIYAIPAAPGDTPTYSVGSELTILDGIIESARFSNGVIQITAKNKYFTGVLAPRFLVNDFSSTIPPVGKSYVWDSTTYDYTTWLASNTSIQKLVRPGTNPKFRGRPTTTEVNEFSNIPKTGYEPISGEGAHLPIIYGRVSVPGYVFVDSDYDDGGSTVKVVGVAWGIGEIASIEQVFINDLPIPATGVVVRHYRGTTYQLADPALRDTIGSSPQYDEDMILDLPQGSIGASYTVFIINTSVVNAVPRFRAVVKGRIVIDEDSAGNSDPFYDSVLWSVDFVNSGATDLGPNSRTVTLNGDASVSSPSIGAELDGTGDSVTIATGSPPDDLGSGQFTIEAKIKPSGVASPADTETILQYGSSGASPGNLGVRIDRFGDAFKLYISSDGLTYDIANGEITDSYVTSSPEVPITIALEHTERQWLFWIDGQNGLTSNQILTPNTSPQTYNGVNQCTGDWSLGTGAGGDFTGEIISARVTVGFARYGGYHTVSRALSTPFGDTGKYNQYAVYSNKPALCWRDLAENQYYGLGATTTGVAEAVAYGDRLMTCGEPRCRIGLALTDPRRVEQWLDILATYADSLWFPEGSDLKIRPDRIAGENSTGITEIVEDGGFDGSPVTAWDLGSPEGWTISGGVATGDGASSQTLSQTVTVETGVRYKLSFDVITTSPLASGSLSVEVDGTAVTNISSVTAAGSYSGYFNATSTSALIAFLGITWTGSIANVSAVPAFYQITADKIMSR